MKIATLIPYRIDQLKPFAPMCIGSASRLGDITIILNDRCFPEQWMAGIKGEKEIVTVMNPSEDWSCYGNRLTLLARAAAHGCGWVLHMDDDFTFPGMTRELLEQDAMEALDNNCIAVSYNLREMWDQKHYRSDGIWGSKRKTVLQRNPLFEPNVCWMNHLQKLHTIPQDVDTMVMTHGKDRNILHWGMSTEELRQARYDKYCKLDPDNRYQACGYEYFKKTEGMELTAI